MLTEAERYEERHFVLHIQILTHPSLDRSQQTTLTSQQSHHYPGKAKKLGSDRVFGNIWKYQIQWFSWRTCTIRAAGTNIECWKHKALGGCGACPPPWEICRIGFSKLQFPAFPGLELGNQNYDRNYLFFFNCMHYITKWIE